MEDCACPKRPKHRGHLLETLAAHAVALVLLLSEGLNLMKPRQAVLQLRVELTHGLLGRAEERPHHLREDDARKENQRDRAAGDERQLPVDGQKNNQNAGKCDEVRYNIRNHMGIQKLEIPRVIDDAAHQVTGLLVVEEGEVETLQFVIEAAPQIAHKVPRRAVRKVVAEKAEEHPQQIESEKD